MSVTSFGAASHELLARHVTVSGAAHPAAPLMSSPAAVFVVAFVITGLLLGILVRALSILCALLQPILALLGAVAIGVVAIVLLLAIILASHARHTSTQRPDSPAAIEHLSHTTA
jgi:hypothetical protein